MAKEKFRHSLRRRPAGRRTLSAALREWHQGQPWSKVQRLFATATQVNGNLCLEEGRKLKAGDGEGVGRTAGSLPKADDAEDRLSRHAPGGGREAGGSGPRSGIPKSGTGPSAGGSSRRRSTR